MFEKKLEEIKRKKAELLDKIRELELNLERIESTVSSLETKVRMMEFRLDDVEKKIEKLQLPEVLDQFVDIASLLDMKIKQLDERLKFLKHP